MAGAASPSVSVAAPSALVLLDTVTHQGFPLKGFSVHFPLTM